MTHEDDDAEELEVRLEIRNNAKAAINKPWAVERRDYRDGSIAYEIWSDDWYYRVCRIVDSDNPTAKRDAEHLAKLHNDALVSQPPSPAKGEQATLPATDDAGLVSRREISKKLLDIVDRITALSAQPMATDDAELVRRLLSAEADTSVDLDETYDLLRKAADRITALSASREEDKEEQRLFDQDLADCERTLDRIRKLIGLPTDHKLEQTDFELWWDKTFSASHDTAGLVKALEDIIDPITALRAKARAENAQLDGAMAVSLSNDPGYLKTIASAALASHAKEGK